MINCIKNSGSRVMDPYMMGMSSMVFMVLDRGMFASYVEFAENRQREETMTVEDHDKEKKLAERIQEWGEKDRESLGRFVGREKSQQMK